MTVEGLPPHWDAFMDLRTKYAYFYNKRTGKSIPLCIHHIYILYNQVRVLLQAQAILYIYIYIYIYI